MPQRSTSWKDKTDHSRVCALLSQGHILEWCNRARIDPDAVYGRVTKKEGNGVAEVLNNGWECPLSNEPTSQSVCCTHHTSYGPRSSVCQVYEPVSLAKPQPKELNAGQLISPPRCVAMGLDAEEYFKVIQQMRAGLTMQLSQLRKKDDLKSILTRARIAIESTVFDTIFAEASKHDKAPNEACSISTFSLFRERRLLHDT